MKITVKKSDNVDVILQTSYTDPLSISEMRDTLILALEQEGYDEYYIDEVFNTRKYELKTSPIPIEAHSLEVFAIKDSESSPTGKEAYIGYKLANEDFHFIQAPYTENIKS